MHTGALDSKKVAARIRELGHNQPGWTGFGYDKQGWGMSTSGQNIEAKIPGMNLSVIAILPPGIIPGLLLEKIHGKNQGKSN